MEVQNKAREAIATSKEAIEAANAGLDLYDRLLDKLVPWKQYDDIIKELDKYRDDYSKECSDLIGKVKTNLMDSMDAYFMSTQSIYEWCGLTTPLLRAYLQLFNDANSDNSAAQKKLLLKVLDDGIVKMTKAKEDLHKSSLSFNEAAGNLTSLYGRLTLDSDEKSEYFQDKVSKMRAQVYGGVAVLGGDLIPKLKKKLQEVKSFYEDLKTKVDGTLTNIDDTKTKLKDEIKVMGDLKTQIETTEEFVNLDGLEGLRDLLFEAVNNLIKKCDEYRQIYEK